MQRTTTVDTPSGSHVRLLVLAWCIALTLYVLIVPTGLVALPTARILNNLAWTGSAALAAWSSWRAARLQQGRARLAWQLFALACAAWTAGQIAWDLDELVFERVTPVPSLSDFGYLAFGPLMIAGLFVLRSTQPARGWAGLRTANLSLVLCALAVVLIAMLSQPFLETANPAAVSFVVVAESSLVTIGFIVALYFLWSYQWGDCSLATVLVTTGLAAQMITGLFYTREVVNQEYAAVSVFNVGWVLAFALQQLAAEVLVSTRRAAIGQPARGMSESEGWIEALAPAVLVLCMTITCIALADEITPRIVYWGSAIVIAFALLLALREGLLHLQGLQLERTLDRSASELAQARERLAALDVYRAELERGVQLTARAGNVGLWEWKVATNEVRYSKGWKRQLGYEDHEIKNDPNEWYSRLHPDDVEKIRRARERVFENPNAEWVHEVRLRHRDGTYRWILTQATLSFDEQGKPQRMLGSHVDITRLKELELSLRDSERRYRELAEGLEERVADRTSELTEAYRESQNFAYAVAHDLKAPLRAIDGFSALLEESASPRMEAAEREYIGRVRRGAIQMAALIDGLLAYSRLEHQAMRIKPVDCRALVDEILRAMSDAIQTAGAECVNTVAATPVLADLEGLRIVLRNLFDNALKFSRAAQPPRIEISSETTPKGFVLCVKDNGIGFDPQYQDKIFEIFNRLHASGYDGTGIGLALARKAMQRMRGRIWAESLPGQGAKFFVQLTQSDVWMETEQIAVSG